jgi:alcohol dehydrogenase class IV
MNSTSLLRSVGQFNNERNYKFIYGQGTVEQLISEMDRCGVSKAMIVTSPSVSKTPLLDRIKSILGERCVEVYPRSKQHAPLSRVFEGAEVFEKSGADCLVDLGGSSAVDMTKGIAMAAKTKDLSIFKGSAKKAGNEKIIHVEQDNVGGLAPIFAIPTTLSGAEFTYQAGLTEDETGKKDQYYERSSLPKTIIMDPEMTLYTPRDLWITTGIKALDHSVERLYSVKSNYFSDAIVLKSIQLLIENLPLCDDEFDNLEVRVKLQLAAFMAQFCTKNVNVGIGHAIDHQLCAIYDIPHGIAPCIMLAHAMEFNKEVANDKLVEMAKALGIDQPTADGAIEAVRNLIKKLGYPTRLREVAQSKEHFDAIAERTLTDTAITGNPRDVEDASQVKEILEKAW